MAEITHIQQRNEKTRYSTVNTTMAAPNATYTIAAASLEASTEYILIFSAGLGEATNSSANAQAQVNEVSGGGVMTASNMTMEGSRGSVSSNNQYFWFDVFTTDGTARDISWQYKSVDGVNEARSTFCDIIAMKTDDLTANDFKFDEDATSRTTLTSASWTDAASVTLGAGDWLILGFSHWVVNSTTDDARMVLDVASTEYSHVQMQGKDTSEEFCLGTMVYLEGVSASTTAKVKVRTTGDLHDEDNARILAIRLDAFEDHFGVHDTSTDTDLTPVNTFVETTTVNTTTSTVATEEFVAFCSSIYDCTEDTKAHRRYCHYDDDGGGDTLFAGSDEGSNTVNVTFDGTDADSFGFFAGTIPTVANGSSLTIDMLVAEEYDVTPADNMKEATIAAFTWELAEQVTNTTISVPTGPWR